MMESDVHSDEERLFKHKKYRTRYAGAHGDGCVVTLPFDPRKGICQACGKSRDKGEIKTTSLHHWRYAYRAETVRKNPILVLENTSELCFACHQIADGLRNIMRLSSERAVQVTMLMPEELKEHLKIFCRLYLDALRKSK